MSLAGETVHADTVEVIRRAEGDCCRHGVVRDIKCEDCTIEGGARWPRPPRRPESWLRVWWGDL